MKQQLYWFVLVLSVGTIGIVVFQPGLITLGMSLIGLKNHVTTSSAESDADVWDLSSFDAPLSHNWEEEREPFFYDKPADLPTVQAEPEPEDLDVYAPYDEPFEDFQLHELESVPESVPESEVEVFTETVMYENTADFSFEDIEEFTMLSAPELQAETQLEPEEQATAVHEDYGFDDLNDFPAPPAVVRIAVPPTQTPEEPALPPLEDLQSDLSSEEFNLPPMEDLAGGFTEQPLDLSVEETPSLRSLQGRAIAAPPISNAEISDAAAAVQGMNGFQSEAVGFEANHDGSFADLQGHTPSPIREDPRLQVQPNLVEVVPCPGAETIARVGTVVILGCDVLPEAKKLVHFTLKDALAAMPPEERAKASEEDIRKQSDMMLAQFFPAVLQQQIQQTLLYCDFMSERSKEEMDMIDKRIGDIFEDDEVPSLMKQFEVPTRSDLNAALERVMGSNLEKEKASFKRRTIAQIIRSQKIKAAEGKCSYEEMLDYYNAHKSEFFHEARSKWMQLSVSVNTERSSEEARKKLVWMANEVLRGVPFEQVARTHSDDLHANKGGNWDWITRGALVSKTLENAVFTSPIGALSPIIEDSNGVHIVKVVAREEEYYTPFRETQASIRKKIQELRRAKKEAEYMQELAQRFKPETYSASITSVGNQETQAVLPQGIGTSLHRRSHPVH